jgi:hypothetical protein
MTETVDQAQARPLRALAGVIEDATSLSIVSTSHFKGSRGGRLTSRRRRTPASSALLAPRMGHRQRTGAGQIASQGTGASSWQGKDGLTLDHLSSSVLTWRPAPRSTTPCSPRSADAA